MHLYVVKFTCTEGTGWAIVNSLSPGYVEGVLKRQSRFTDINVLSYKEIEYIGNEKSLICEGVN